MKKVWLVVVAMVVVAYAGVALACGGHGKKLELSDKAGGGYVVTMAPEGCPTKAADKIDKFAAMVESCYKGTCTCPHKEKCPFDVQGVTYEVVKSATGVTVNVASADAAKLAEFKTRFDAFKAEGGCGCGGKGDCGCGGSGDCKCGKEGGDCGCGGSGDCKCGADCKCGKGCKGDGSCGCGGDKDGSCPHKKDGGCGCGGDKAGSCPHKKEGGCGCGGGDPLDDVLGPEPGKCPNHP